MIYQYSAGAGQFLHQAGQRGVAQHSGHSACISVAPPSSYLPPSIAAASAAPGATGVSCANSQAGMPQASCLAGSAMCSPAIKMRASRSEHPNVLRAIPTPARAGTKAPVRGEEKQTWGTDCVAWLAAEGDEGRYSGRARFLDPLSVTSVKGAVDGLNRHSIWCPEDVCVVFAAAHRAYYLVYRRGGFDAALVQLGVTREELARASAAAGASSPRKKVSEGRPGLCEVSEQVPIVGRPRTSLVEASSAPSKVQRQVSMPSRTGGTSTPGAPPPVPAASLQERPSDAPFVAAWMQPRSSATGPHSTPASTPGVPPSVAAASLQLPPAAVATPVTSAVIPVATPYPRFSSPGPARSHRTSAGQSFIPAPAAAHAAPSGGAQALVTARPPARAPIAKGAGKRVEGAEPRYSLVVAVPHPSPAPPSRRGPSTGGRPSMGAPVVTAIPAVEKDGDSSELQDEDHGRALAEIEKVNYSDLNFVENLGSGEFGQVFRGFYQGEEVAIKKLYWDETSTDLVLQELAKEIESFRLLSHKRLVRFIGASFEKGNPCLVTQYMPGGSLHHLLHVRKLQLPTLHATNMCLQLADGVSYLHSQNPTIVHRDLKSLNVVLDLSLNVKICDFGLTESMERTHITKRNNGGSPRYMAPELFDCKTKITEKIDMWALGCIFVEIFGGPLPYSTINALADLTREILVHKRSPFVPEHIFEDIKMVIHSCLKFDHCERLTSKQAFDQLVAAKKQMRKAGKLEDAA